MKKIKLSDGRTVQIGTQFGEERPNLERPLPTKIAHLPFRSTHMRLTVFDKEGKEIGELTGVSYCNPVDRYDRIEGRKKAMKRLFAANRSQKLLTLEDCHVISPVLLRGKISEGVETVETAETVENR